MNGKPPIDCLLVTGMYKSGLSALTACLQVLGVNIGQRSDFMRNRKASEKTDANDASLIHDILFRDLGYSWDRIGNLPHGWLNSSAAKTARRRIGSLIESRFENKGLWAVADPRLCRLMPLWFSILDEKGIQPGVLLMLRHPLEVASSLKMADGLDEKRSHFLWFALNRDAMNFSSDRPNKIITYDQLVADPVTYLNSIEPKFQMAFPNSLPPKMYDILDRVRPDLKNHHLSKLRELNQNGDLSSAFEQIYKEMVSHRIKETWSKNETVSVTAMNVLPEDSQRISVNPSMAFDRGRDRNDQQLLGPLFDLIGQFEQEQKELVCQKEQRLSGGDPEDKLLAAEVCSPPSVNETATATESILLKEGVWQQIRFPISYSKQLMISGLEILPLNTRGVVAISAIRLINISTGEALWQAAEPEAFKSIQLKDAISLQNKDNFAFVTLTDRAVLTLPSFPELPDAPMELIVWMKVHPSQEMFAETIADNEISLLKQIEEFSQNLTFQQKRTSELEQALEQSHSTQKTLRNVVYKASLDLYDRKETEEKPFDKDFLNDENVFIDKSVIGYDAHWQYPTITEKHAFIKAKELLPVSDDTVYFGFPWATLIDTLHTKAEDRDKLSEKLRRFVPLLKNFKVVVTACQHINLIKYRHLFEEAGVTHIFWSHTMKGMYILPGRGKIKTFPLPLYPVYAQGNVLERNPKENRYLFSFIGAIDKPWYLTDTRSLIINNLSNADRGKIISRESWHFDRVVYDHQIRGKRINRELIDFQSTKEYQEILMESMFTLCPSGSGPNSIRLWEAIGCGSIPVILSDTYQPPGPSSLWEEAVVWCQESLDDILLLPEYLSEVALDKELVDKKLNALKHLWAIYGPDMFIYDIINLFKYH